MITPAICDNKFGPTVKILSSARERRIPRPCAFVPAGRSSRSCQKKSNNGNDDDERNNNLINETSTKTHFRGNFYDGSDGLLYIFMVEINSLPCRCWWLKCIFISSGADKRATFDFITSAFNSVGTKRAKIIKRHYSRLIVSIAAIHMDKCFIQRLWKFIK